MVEQATNAMVTEPCAHHQQEAQEKMSPTIIEDQLPKRVFPGGLRCGLPLQQTQGQAFAYASSISPCLTKYCPCGLTVQRQARINTATFLPSWTPEMASFKSDDRWTSGPAMLHPNGSTWSRQD